MIIVLFSSSLFVLGLLAINTELRLLLGVSGSSALIFAKIAVGFSLSPSTAPDVLSSGGMVQLGVAFCSGVLTGIPMALVYQAVGLFSRIIDLSAGLLIAEQLQPGSMERQSPTQSILVLGAAAAIFSPGLFTQIGESFSLLQSNVTFDLEHILYLTGESLRCGVLLALPVVGLLLTLEIGAGFFGRYLQPINLAPELPAIKLLLTILFICFCGGSLLSNSAREFLEFRRAISSINVRR